MRSSHIRAVARAGIRELLRRRVAMGLLVALPAAFYLTNVGSSSASLFAAGLGVAWAAGAGALFTTQGAAVIEQRLRLTGFSRIELALGRSAVVVTIAITVSVVTIPMVWVISQPPKPVGLVMGVVTMTAVAGSLGMLLGVVTSRDLESTIALIGVIGIDVSLANDDRFGYVLPLRGPIELMRYSSGSRVHDLGAIVPAVVWTVALVVMVTVAYHRRWRLHTAADPIKGLPPESAAG